MFLHKPLREPLKCVITASVFITLFLAATSGLATQADSLQGTPRKITSDDFTKKRQKAQPSTTNSKGSKRQNSDERPRPHSYQLASPPAVHGGPYSTKGEIAQLGITVWRLRSVSTGGDGYRALIREKSASTNWVPERVAAESSFREGDRVRLSVESPESGYLYVVNRDLFADGTTGKAMLIYPWLGINNQLLPGRLIDIPAQEDNPSYFTARLTSSNQVGELLTFIVTSSPLDLSISDDPIQIADVQMSKWEKLWSGPTERFELEGGAGEAWTPEEQKAAAKKAARQLTRDDPVPQTIYRVSTGDTTALLVHLRLNYEK